jgi:hypothetical protein
MEITTNWILNSTYILTKVSDKSYWRESEERPKATYAWLIKQAIHESENKKATKHHIINWIRENFAYYRTSSHWHVRILTHMFFNVFKLC